MNTKDPCTVGCKGNTIITASGRYFDFADPKPEQIYIADIARALSNTCRYGGHCEFYSVAEHCVHCANAMSSHSRRLQFLGLMHDAAEAYIGDVPKPLKLILPDYNQLETKVERVIREAFEIDVTEEEEKLVKKYDLAMLKAEKQQLFQDAGEWEAISEQMDVDAIIACWNPKRARTEFLDKFNGLY